MRIGTLFLVTIACVALNSCSSPGMLKANYVRGGPNPFVTSVPCPAQDCTVEVRVIWDAAANTCRPDLPEYLDVSVGATGQRNITWTIATPGYEFSRESYKFGIFIKSDPDDEFKNVQISGARTSLSLQFRNGRPRTDYAYVLALRKTTGDKQFCETLDPWIIS